MKRRALETNKSAARLDLLLCHTDLFSSLIKRCPNGKLPAALFTRALMNVHVEKSTLWPESARDGADKWSGVIRLHLTKLRELVQYPAKYEIIKKKVFL